jgi:hypothetical protein
MDAFGLLWLVPLGFWVLVSGGIGYLASQRGRSWFGYTAVSLVLSPILGYVILVMTTSGEAGRVKCPACAELIRPDASVCRFCRAEIRHNSDVTGIRRNPYL